MKIQAITAAAATALLLGATGASALTFTVSPSSFNESQNDFLSNLQSEFGSGNLGFGFVLSVEADGTETLGFTKYGADSSFENTFNFGGAWSGSLVESDECYGGTASDGPSGCSNNTSPDSDSTQFSGGLLDAGDLQFTSNNGSTANIGDAGMGLFYDKTGDAQYAFLGFDDGGGDNDGSHGDFLVKVEAKSISVVPLPAAAWLLLGAAGGLIAAKRRAYRKAA